MILFCARETPKWNPMNVCSYHLQEAGATPVQELSYALATAIAVLERVRQIGRGRREGFRQRGRQHLVLRQRRHALRDRTRQDAGVRRIVGRDHPRPVRRDRPVEAPLPLRRPGQLARPHRAAAGEQRLPHPDRDAVGGAVEDRARPRGPAAGLERGARPAAAVRPAMVAAPAADHGLRDGPSGVRRHLRRQQGDRGAGREAQDRGAGRDRRDRRDGRRGQGDRDRRAEERSWSNPTRAASRRSSAASRSSSASTPSPIPSPRR